MVEFGKFGTGFSSPVSTVEKCYHLRAGLGARHEDSAAFPVSAAEALRGAAPAWHGGVHERRTEASVFLRRGLFCSRSVFHTNKAGGLPAARFFSFSCGGLAQAAPVIDTDTVVSRGRRRPTFVPSPLGSSRLTSLMTHGV